MTNDREVDHVHARRARAGWRFRGARITPSRPARSGSAIGGGYDGMPECPVDGRAGASPPPIVRRTAILRRTRLVEEDDQRDRASSRCARDADVAARWQRKKCRAQSLLPLHERLLSLVGVGRVAVSRPARCYRGHIRSPVPPGGVRRPCSNVSGRCPSSPTCLDEDLARVCGEALEVQLEPGEVLFREGEPGDRAYVVTAGELDVVRATDGRQVLVAVQGEGGVLGEPSKRHRAQRRCERGPRPTCYRSPRPPWTTCWPPVRRSHDRSSAPCCAGLEKTTTCSGTTSGWSSWARSLLASRTS